MQHMENELGQGVLVRRRRAHVEDRRSFAIVSPQGQTVDGQDWSHLVYLVSLGTLETVQVQRVAARG
jgi:hypothetical protein